MRKIHYITVHTQAAYDPKKNEVITDRTGADVRDYHMDVKGWDDAGYHAFIRYDGVTDYLRPVDKAPAAVRTFNSNILAVCLAGHGDYLEPSTQQYGALLNLCITWCEEYGLEAEHVVGHHECDELLTYTGPKIYKTCPGKLVDMHKLRVAVANNLRKSVKGITFTDNPRISLSQIRQIQHFFDSRGIGIQWRD